MGITRKGEHWEFRLGAYIERMENERLHDALRWSSHGWKRTSLFIQQSTNRSSWMASLLVSSK